MSNPDEESRPSIRVKHVLMVGALAASVAMFVGMFTIYARDSQKQDRARVQASGQTALANCGQIEAVKQAIRGVLRDTRDRLPMDPDLKNNPDRLSVARASLSADIARFKPRDCYEVPVVKLAGIKPKP